MNRRTFLAAAAGVTLATTAGCAESGIFEDKGGRDALETATLPELTARDASPDGATTTFEIRWRAIGATQIDANPDDAMTSTPFGGEGKFVILAHETENVGDEAHQFDPESYSLETEERIYQPTALTHLTPYSPRPLNPDRTTTGWVPFTVEADLPAAEIFVNQTRYQTPVAVDFEQDSSVPLPF